MNGKIWKSPRVYSCLSEFSKIAKLFETFCWGVLKVTGPIATSLFQSHGSLVFQHGEIRLWHKEPYSRANTSQAIYKYLVHPQYSWDLRAYHTIELVLYYGGLQITVCTLSATKRHNILLDTHPHPFLQLFITAIYFLLKRHSQCFVLGGRGDALGKQMKAVNSWNWGSRQL